MVIYLPQIQLCQIQCLLLPSHINSHPIIKLNSAHNGLIHEAHLPAWYVHSSPTPFPSTPDGVGGQKYPPKQTYRSSSLRPTSPLTSPTATPQHPIELGAYDVSLSGQEGHHQTFAIMTLRPPHPHPHPHPHPNQTEV